MYTYANLVYSYGRLVCAPFTCVSMRRINCEHVVARTGVAGCNIYLQQHLRIIYHPFFIELMYYKTGEKTLQPISLNGFFTNRNENGGWFVFNLISSLPPHKKIHVTSAEQGACFQPSGGFSTFVCLESNALKKINK